MSQPRFHIIRVFKDKVKFIIVVPHQCLDKTLDTQILNAVIGCSQDPAIEISFVLSPPNFYIYNLWYGSQTVEMPSNRYALEFTAMVWSHTDWKDSQDVLIHEMKETVGVSIVSPYTSFSCDVD